MRDQHVRAGDARVLKRRVQLVRHAAGCAWLRTRSAPPEARPVVGDDAAEGRQLRLHDAPVQGRLTEPGLQDNGGTAAALDHQVHEVAVDVDQLAGRRVALGIAA